MNWTVQLIEVVVLLAFGAAVHLTMVHLRRPLLVELGKLAGRAAGTTRRITDLVLVILYVGFVAAIVPPPPAPLDPPLHAEDVLDAVGLAALVLVTLEVVGMAAIHRIAHDLDPWPRTGGAASRATA